MIADERAYDRALAGVYHAARALATVVPDYALHPTERKLMDELRRALDEFDAQAFNQKGEIER